MKRNALTLRQPSAPIEKFLLFFKKKTLLSC
jgi:hypothetical protein